MTAKLKTGADFFNQRAQNAADATANNDLTTLQQVRALINARSPKDDVVAKSNANVNLASPGANIDGIAFTVGWRFIAAAQTTGSQNGIYVYNGAAVPATRAPDADTMAELSGAVVVVQRGTDADKLFLVTNDDTDVLDTTTINFLQTGAGNTYGASANGGIQLTGSNFELKENNTSGDSGLDVGANGVKVDPAIVPRKFTGQSTAVQVQTITHNLGTQDIAVWVREVSTGQLVLADVVIVDGNSCTIDYGAVATIGQYRYIVIG